MGDSNFSVLRRTMVDCQIRPADVTDYVILEALLWAPRERFLPERLRPFAYADRDFRLPADQVLLAPRTFAKMLQVGRIGPSDMVLDVGCGYGYSAAVVSRLAEAVVALVPDAGIAEEATAALADLGVENCAVLPAPLTEGVPEQGPFDVILVEGGIERLPDALAGQLKDGGRLVAVHMAETRGECRVRTRTAAAHSEVSVFDATAPVLPGFEAMEEFAF